MLETTNMSTYRMLVERAAQHALEVSIPEVAWFTAFGFKHDPFEELPISREEERLFVGREQEISELTTALTFSLRGAKGCVALVAPQGAGKTSILNLVDSYFDEIVRSKSPDLAGKIVPERYFSMREIYRRIDANEQETAKDTLSLLISTLSEKPAYLIVDDCETDISAAVSVLEQAPSSAKYLTLFITVWTPSSYSRLNKEEPEFAKKLKRLYVLSPLSDHEINEVLKRRLQLSSRTDIMDEEAAAKISSHSRGIPGMLLALAKESFIEASRHGAQRVSVEHVEVALQRLGFSVKASYDSMTSAEKRLVRQIVEHGGRATADQVAEWTDLTRSTCVFHLSRLMKEGLLRKERYGKPVFYIVPSLIELELNLMIQYEFDRRLS